MIVCHCKALTDRDLCDVLRQGAASAAEVERACGAGGECGGCRPHVQMLVTALSIDQASLPRERAVGFA